MARSCAICGKVSMGGFNPQSSGMNRVRAHRRYQPNLQPFTMTQNGTTTKVDGLHALPPHGAEVREVAPRARRNVTNRSQTSGRFFDSLPGTRAGGAAPVSGRRYRARS